MNLVERIHANIREQQLISPGDRLLVAVSGGLDSVVLLHVLHSLASVHQWKLSIGHFNHQLRGQASNADEAFVRQLAGNLDLQFVAGRGAVQENAEATGLSLEMAAREARHLFFAQTAQEVGARICALGHHADDQVELFLLRLLRGTAGEGLTGMRWKSPSPASPNLILVRPLLNITRAELEQYASAEKLKHQHDESNDQLHFERNKIRHKLLPFLRDNFQQNIHRNILRLVEVLTAEKEFLRSETARLASLGYSFEQLPLAVQRQLLVSELLALQIGPAFDLVEALRKEAGLAVMVAPGATLERQVDGKILRRSCATLDFNLEKVGIDPRAPGELTFAGLSLSWRSAPLPLQWKSKNQVEFFDAEKIGGPIQLRHWQPGDRYQPIGMSEPVKLQDLFTNAGIPAGKRRKLVLAAAASGEIFWVEGLRISELFKISPRTGLALEWHWKRSTPLAE